MSVSNTTHGDNGSGSSIAPGGGHVAASEEGKGTGAPFVCKRRMLFPNGEPKQLANESDADHKTRIERQYQCRKKAWTKYSQDCKQLEDMVLAEKTRKDARNRVNKKLERWGLPLQSGTLPKAAAVVAALAAHYDRDHAKKAQQSKLKKRKREEDAMFSGAGVNGNAGGGKLGVRAGGVPAGKLQAACLCALRGLNAGVPFDEDLIRNVVDYVCVLYKLQALDVFVILKPYLGKTLGEAITQLSRLVHGSAGIAAASTGAKVAPRKANAGKPVAPSAITTSKVAAGPSTGDTVTGAGTKGVGVSPPLVVPGDTSAGGDVTASSGANSAAKGTAGALPLTAEASTKAVGTRQSVDGDGYSGSATSQSRNAVATSEDADGGGQSGGEDGHSSGGTGLSSGGEVASERRRSSRMATSPTARRAYRDRNRALGQAPARRGAMPPMQPWWKRATSAVCCGGVLATWNPGNVSDIQSAKWTILHHLEYSGEHVLKKEDFRDHLS